MLGSSYFGYINKQYKIYKFDFVRNKNIELMERGRGQKYGFCGGTGGQG